MPGHEIQDQARDLVNCSSSVKWPASSRRISASGKVPPERLDARWADLGPSASGAVSRHQTLSTTQGRAGSGASRALTRRTATTRPSSSLQKSTVRRLRIVKLYMAGSAATAEGSSWGARHHAWLYPGDVAICNARYIEAWVA